MSTDPPRKPVIFVVDDDENILRALRIALAREYRVVTQNNPIKAVGDVQATCPDVVLLDIKMPERDGFWVFAEIRKFDTQVPIIFNSAYQDVMAPEDAQGTFAPFGYLPKTGRLGDLLELVRKALASRRMAS